MGLGVAVAIAAIFILPDTGLIGDTVISIKTTIVWGLIDVTGSLVSPGGCTG
jgi:hypothetical protein